ncbi:RAMP superfamily CRISPR-associated protein [Lusitaniella coriacea]|uniref:RAMP superfamily CRISPR-associated protein n=1 Tax=Lusitaniella coriacea TaxID=1983105 RepID=UPI003CEF97EB
MTRWNSRNQPTRGNNKALERPKNPKAVRKSKRKISPDNVDWGADAPEDLSPWLVTPNNPPVCEASFVEYLRWMRSPKPERSDKCPEKAENNATKLHLLQIAQQRGDYRERLDRLAERLRRIVGSRGEILKVQCPWRIRVGGHRGPESMLLPAFDALGMPYIPSSTLRGIARTQAIRAMMVEHNLSFKQAEQHEAIVSHFGSLEAEAKGNRAGKIVFLDAYPLPETQNSVAGGLALDIANRIWDWKQLPEYNPNPNLFFSLEKPTFLIGLLPASNCRDETMLEQVKKWLQEGLAAGVGSQINTGYGRLTEDGKVPINEPLFTVRFTLSGQLIHSYSIYSELARPYQLESNGEVSRTNDGRGDPKTTTRLKAEVRPTAFKSMLRYWFRTLALGLLSARRVKELEAFVFGAIEPQSQGWVQVQIDDFETVQEEPQTVNKRLDDDHGIQKGKLVLSASPEVPSDEHDLLKELMRHLTWLMFHLGGVGLGARRPLHSRKHRPKPRPPWRGSKLKSECTDSLWDLPDDVEAFKPIFLSHLKQFRKALSHLQKIYCQQHNRESEKFVLQQQKTLSNRDWEEAIDRDCCILVCSRQKASSQPFALSVLHREQFKRSICKQGSRPSPVWIADFGMYQVVTIFGVKHNPESQQTNLRNEYFQVLKKDAEEYKILWFNR